MGIKQIKSDEGMAIEIYKRMLFTKEINPSELNQVDLRALANIVKNWDSPVREIIYKRFKEGFTRSRISEELGLSIDVVRNHEDKFIKQIQHPKYRKLYIKKI